MRVNELFDKAASKGVNVENQSVEDDDCGAGARRTSWLWPRDALPLSPA